MTLQRKPKTGARWFNPEIQIRRARANLRAPHWRLNHLAPAFDLRCGGLLSSFVILVSSLSAADPAELRVVVTEEPVTMEQIERTKQYGARIRVMLEGRGREAGLEEGDIICAVDGWRVFDKAAYALARYSAPMNSEIRLLVNRDGELRWITASGLEPGRAIGVRFDTDFNDDRLEAVVQAAGVRVDERMSATLRTAPRRLAAELELHPTKKGDTAWLQAHLQLFTNVREGKPADASPRPAPIPIFERLNKFYAAVAARSEDLPPDPAACGESPEFYGLYRPVPDFKPPPTGRLALSDKEFQKLLEKKWAVYPETTDEMSAAAFEYASFGPDRTASFVGQARAAVLDPINHGGWPYRSGLIYEPEPRQRVLGELLPMLEDTASPDWPMLALAAVAPLTIEGRAGEAADLIRRIGEHSPFLAWRATGISFEAAKHWKLSSKRIEPIVKVAGEAGFFLPADQPELFRWTLREVNAVLLWSQEWPLQTDPVSLWKEANYSVVEALKGGERTNDKD